MVERWAGRDLRGRDLRGASLAGADLRGCRLDDAGLQGADLWGANLALASLRRADLRGARLSCASFAGADLRAAKLGGSDLALCDLAGAHLACVELGRPRTGAVYVLARSCGYASFADALACSALEASWMRAGPALLAVDAAIDVSPDLDGEIGALLGEADWRIIVVGTLAAARRRGGSSTRLLDLLSRATDHVAATAAVALTRSGCPAEEIVARCPGLAVARADGVYRGAYVWRELVQRRLAHVDAWACPRRAAAA